MRLIDTTTLHLHNFVGSDRPDYAILSHTWDKEEVSLHEWMEARIEAKRGFTKIQNACRIALVYGCDYIWIDTNCIDKKSSAELSEAINSMFSWYQTSEICFAYLEDFPAGTPTEHMSKCRWFTRGWTLQELLAPRNVEFLNATWEAFGTKALLCTEISGATGIDTATLCEPREISSACAAKKMSWASSRQTTRAEDIAYCLLGLFNINMPLLYGEGNDAFRRLQEEIIKVSTDQSLFAWEWPSTVPRDYFRGTHSVTTLAPFPSAFKICHDVVAELQGVHPRHREFAMTNFGLNIALRLLFGEHGACFGALACRYGSLGDSLICIPLSTSDSSSFYRDHTRDIMTIPRRYLPKQPTSISLPRISESRDQSVSSGFLRPSFGRVSTLLFTLGEARKTWEVRTLWRHRRGTQATPLLRKDIPYDLRAISIIVRNRESNLQWIFIVIWAAEVDWRHACSEAYVGDSDDDGYDEGDVAMRRIASRTSLTGSSKTYCGNLLLEVGHFVTSSDGGRWLPLFLSRLKGIRDTPPHSEQPA
ncbi:Vegetative incompatibility protein HET-E-1 [Colletotrichum siamense]|uniref:Vegetative incompatibility protein HET-E-1 n=1 Tax=Colletotrichum siamense TaxID=690259 RepID=UPI001872CC18|nr:Vegetative incompatibility protein HET-E-1 [Colletotrichum siamense]KAF5515557.1 Vegetative incompatibility protein HET-E-1 [Colletotrichum siamense]